MCNWLYDLKSNTQFAVDNKTLFRLKVKYFCIILKTDWLVCYHDDERIKDHKKKTDPRWGQALFCA